MNYWLILIPVISAFIGWVTNWVAIKMLFHPRRPVKILFFTVQGVFPKRQQVFATRLGKMVSSELLSFDDIQQKISNPKNLDSIMPMIEKHIDDFLRVKLSDEMPFLSMFIGDKTIASLKRIFTEELKTLFPHIMKNYAAGLRSELDLEKIVTSRVAGFSSEKLEAILMQVMRKEFVFVEITGGIIGFIIGIVQVLITLLTA